MHTEVNTHYYWKYRKKWKWIHLSYVRIYCFIILAKGRRKLAWTFCLLVSLTLFFRRLYKTLQSVILNNIENPKYMENLKISFLAYCLFSEFLILEDYMLTIWGEVIFLCLMKTKIMYLTYFQIIKRICWKANISFVCIYDGSYGSRYDEYSQQSKNKREIPKSNKRYHWKYQSQYYFLEDYKQDR